MSDENDARMEELDGLIAVAKAHQAKAEADKSQIAHALRGLKAASDVLDRQRTELPRLVQAALDQVVPKQLALLGQAVQAYQVMLRSISWAWMALALMIGIVVGGGVVLLLLTPPMLAIRDSAERADQATTALYWQSPEGKVEKARQEKARAHTPAASQ